MSGQVYKYGPRMALGRQEEKSFTQNPDKYCEITLSSEKSARFATLSPVSDVISPPGKSIDKSIMVDVEKYSDRDKMSFGLTAKSIGIVVETAHRTNSVLEKFLHENTKIFAKKRQTDHEFIRKTREFIDSSAQKIDNHETEINKKSNEIVAILHDSSSVFAKKTEIEEFVKDNEGVYEENEKVLEMMDEDAKRVHFIRSMLHFNKSPPVGFEKEDSRIGEVYSQMTDMIRNELPLSDDEHCEMDQEIGRIEKNGDLDGKGKVEMVAMHLLAMMSTWDKNPTPSISSANWRTVPPNPIVHHKFIPEFSSTDDSNLTDIDGILRAARIKRAIGEPIDIDTWSSASRFSNWSSDGLSSYGSLKSSVASESFSSSSSGMLTAFSQDSTLIQNPPRSIITNSTPQKATGALTTASNASLNFSTISLGEMIGDALFKAKTIAETQANNVLETLGKSIGGSSSSYSTASQSSSHMPI